MGMSSLYPKSPENVPRDLLKLTGSYKFRTASVLLAIFLFILLYFALVFVAGYYVYYAFTYDMGRVSRGTLLLKGGAIATSVMLFFFMVKFLFKRQLHDESRYIEIDPYRHPDLRDFIRRLCAETGAPEPHKIFVSAEINAAVFYNSTILSLFLPTKKNLLIGLGLVNSLTLSEFKAVLAHEFGHFSQKSMRLGSYVYMANRIISDMVYNRDKWDEVLVRWSKLDFRIAVFAWILLGTVYVLRGILRLLYTAINLLHASLSRQMEYNADLVAVKVTGSDAIISGLAQLEPASVALNKTFSYAAAAVDHKLFSRDLFYHHDKMLGKLLKEKPVSSAGNPASGVTYLFAKRDQHAIDMYSSHPCNYDRERNAKKTYIPGVVDSRSPWLLFRNADRLRFQVTERLYRLNTDMPDTVEWNDPAKVEAFIEAEMSETSYDQAYHGAYEGRYLTEFNTADMEVLCREVGVIDKETAIRLKDDLWGEELRSAVMAMMKKREELSELYRAIAEATGDKIRFNDKILTKEQAAANCKTAENEHEKLHAWFGPFDKKVFVVHRLLAEGREEGMAELLTARYAFHFMTQSCLKTAHSLEDGLKKLYLEIQAKGETTEEEMVYFRHGFKTLHETLASMRGKANDIKMVPLSHMEEYRTLGAFVFAGTTMSDPLLDGDSFRAFSAINGTVLFRLRRIFFKSLKEILSFQESIRRSPQ